MTIGPTVAGGLKLVPEEDQDWVVLLEIANDGDGDLSKRLAGLMDEESMWEEIVVPELEEEFKRQRLEVVMAVIKAKSEREAVHIDKETAETWYGALNQARLELEARYHFGPREHLAPHEIKDEAARAALYRSDFYSAVQNLLLRYVMVE
jgi:hypothetical protein